MGKKIVQFGYVRVSPESMNWGPVLDCRIIKNPFNRIDTDEVLREKVRHSRFFEELVEQGVKLLDEHDVIYIGCYGGRHRSWAVSDAIAEKTGASIERF